MSIDSFVRRMRAAVTPVVETAAAAIRFDDGTPAAETANMRRVENEPRDEGLLQQVKNRLIVQGAGLDENATLVEITEPADRTERASTYLVKLSDGSKVSVRGRVGNVEGDRVRLLVDSVETAGTSKGGKFFPYKKELEALGITLKTDGEDYIVNLKGGKEATAYYTPDLEDAYVSGKSMAEAEKAGAETAAKSVVFYGTDQTTFSGTALNWRVNAKKAGLNLTAGQRAGPYKIASGTRGDKRVTFIGAVYEDRPLLSPKVTDETASVATQLRNTVALALHRFDEGEAQALPATLARMGLKGDYYNPDIKRMTETILKLVDSLSDKSDVRIANYHRLLKLAESNGRIQAGHLPAMTFRRS